MPIRILSLFIILFPVLAACQQNASDVPPNTLYKFQKYFNESDYEELYSLFGDKLKARNTPTKLRLTMEPLKTTIGGIKSLDFIGRKAGISSFKSTHENAIIAIEMAADDFGKITHLETGPYIPDNAKTLERNITSVDLPFEDEWYVFWGGNTTSKNYHNGHASMYGAFDFWVMGSNGKSHKTNGQSNEDYYAFGKEIIAPCDGTISWVLSGTKDNIPPAINRNAGYGNMVILSTDSAEHFIFAHLKYQSIVVENGQKVKKGQKIGHCGNSGNSTEPHLHFGLQNTSNPISTQGSFTYFQEILVDGVLKKDHLPERGEKIRNIKQQLE